MRDFLKDLRWIRENGLARETLAWIFFATLLRYVFAWIIPLANDEAYYWDWGRALHLSYYDHPPGVSWLAAIGRMIFGDRTEWGMLSARAVIPLMHGFATCTLLAIVGRVGRVEIADGSAKSVLRRVLVLTQVAPVIGLGGIFLMPDAGLIVAVSLVAWFLLASVKREKGRTLSFADGIIAGVLCGLAGLFKYHAVALCGGLLGSLLLIRRNLFQSEKTFWLTTVATGILMCTPVWVWNFRNDMASFAFQASHGFGALEFQPLFAARLFAGLVIFFTPYFLWHLTATLFDRKLLKRPLFAANVSALILIAGALPLILIIVALMPFKQILPHWVVPSFWLLIPLAALKQPQWPRLWKLNGVFALVFSLALCLGVSVPEFRRRLIEAAQGKPGGLGEMIVWRPLVEDPRITQLARTATIQGASDRESCPRPFAWASMRWYSVAQLAFALPGKPKVWSVETGRYYYHFRDQLSDLAGCTILVVGETGHYDSRWIDSHFIKTLKGEIVVAGHDDRPFTWVLGKFVP